MIKQTYIDTRNLSPLSDGRNPLTLNRFALAHALIAEGLDLAPDSPMQDSLLAWGQHCKEKADAERKVAR